MGQNVPASEMVVATAGKAVAVSSESIPAAKSATKNPSRTLEPIMVKEEEEEVDAIEYFSTEAKAAQAAAAAVTMSKNSLFQLTNQKKPCHRGLSSIPGSNNYFKKYFA